MSSAVCASIGLTGRSGVSRKRARPSAPSRIAASATGGEIAGEHRRAAHVRERARRPPSRPRPSSRPRALLAGARRGTAHEQPLLRLRRPREERAELLAASGLRAAPGDRLQAGHGGIDLERRRASAPARAPAAPSAPPTPRRPSPAGARPRGTRRRRDLVGRRVAQALARAAPPSRAATTSPRRPAMRARCR